MEQQNVGQLVQLARSLGWINDQQIALASHSYSQARQAGHKARIGQALVHVHALSENQVLQLLERLGIAVLGCQRCGQAWNAALQSTPSAICPVDGSALQRVATLQVLGDLAPRSVHGTVADSPLLDSVTIATNTGPGIGVPENFSQSHRAESADKYEVTKELGRGGMGAVYLAKDKELERDVAMKVILDGGGDSNHARFIEEARITGQLEHPNIIPVHELGMKGMDPYFTMTFVRGQSLKALIDSHSAGNTEVSLQKYLSIFMKILDGVSFAHAHKVLHRDLKPENIMLGEHGEVLVMDWGLAKAIEAGKVKKKGKVSKDAAKRRVKSLREAGGEDSAWTMDGEITGTPNYMSPEQADGSTAELGPGSDIFSLGIILYEMLTLKKAFPGGAIQAINKVLKVEYVEPKVAAGKRFVPPELAAVVKKAMSLDIGDRYQTIQEFQNDIDQFMSGRAVSARRDPVLTAVFKWMKRNPTLTVLGVIVLPLMLFIMSYIFLRPGTLILNVEQMPVNSVIRVGSEEIMLKAGIPTIERRVWPFIGTEVHAVRGFSPPFLPFQDAPEYKVAVNSDQTVKLSLSPSFKECKLQLVLEGSQGATVSIRRTLALPKTVGSMSAALKSKSSALVSLRPKGKEGGKAEVTLLSGQYQLDYSEPGFFSNARVVHVTEAKRNYEVIDFTPMSVSKYEFASEVLDYKFGDVDLDGFLDLVIARKTHIECYSVKNGNYNLLWSRAFETAENNAIKGRHLAIADLDDDGQLEVICMTKFKLVRLDARTGNILGDVDIHDPRFRVLPLDKGQAPSIIVGTGYKGVQRFNGRGERLWGCLTARYAGYSPFHQVRLPGKPYSVILAKSVQPFRLYAIRSDNGALLWKKKAKKEDEKGEGVGDGKIYVINSESSPTVLLQFASTFQAFDAEDGRLKWEKQGTEFQRLMVAPFKFKGPERILSITNKWVVCYDMRGKELWADQIDAYFGPSAMGDIDGDQSDEWICSVNPVTDAVETASEKKGTKTGTKSFEIRAYSSSGKKLSSIRVPASGKVMRLKPTIVQFEKNGERLLFVVQQQKCVLYQFGRPKFRRNSRDRIVVQNIDHRGTDEIIRVRPNRSLECSGDVRWKIDVEEGKRIQFNPAQLSFGDINGDGFEDLTSRGFLNTSMECLFVISGKDGQVLMCQPMSENPGQAPLIGPPLKNGERCLVYFGNKKIYVYQLDPDSTLEKGVKEGRYLFSTLWNKGDARAYIETTGRPRVFFCHKGGTFASLALEAGSQIEDLMKVSEYSTHTRIIKIGNEYAFTGAMGSLFLVTEQKSKRALKVFESGISSLIRRESEFIAVSEFGEIAIVDMNPLAISRKFKLSQFDGPKSWKISLKDINNDSNPELLLHASDGTAMVLDARTFKTLHLSVSGVSNDEQNEIVSYPAQLADMNGDGKLDLISTIGIGTRIVSDIAGEITSSQSKAIFGEDPLLSVSYMRREFLTGMNEAKIDLYLERLKGSIHERFARILAYQQTRNPRYVSKAIEAPESYLVRLAQHYDIHKNFDNFKTEAMGQTLGVQLELIAKLLRTSAFSSRKMDQIVERLRKDIQGNRTVEDLWLSRLRNAVFNRQFRSARDLGELMLTFFPQSQRARALYEQTMISQALTLHRSFQRTQPRLLIARALKYLDSSRLHVYYANFHERRNFPNPEKALDHLNSAVKLSATRDAFALTQRAYYHYRKINASLRQKNQQKARTHLALAAKDVDAALMIQSDHRAALAVAGLLNLMQRKNSPALTCLNQALATGPGSIDDSFDLAYLALFNKGKLLMQMGNGREGYNQILAARRLIEPGPRQNQEDFQMAMLIARSDKGLAASILKKLLPQVNSEEQTLIQQKLKELGH